MNFIQSHRANVSQPINLDHVVTFTKNGGFGDWRIWFHTLSGETICWQYRNNRSNQILDYEDIKLITGLSEQEDN